MAIPSWQILCNSWYKFSLDLSRNLTKLNKNEIKRWKEIKIKRWKEIKTEKWIEKNKIV